MNESENNQVPLSTPAIELKGVSKRYSLSWRSKAVLAVSDLDLSIERGEVIGLLGPNGSGKSTTLKMILGLARPTVGQVRVLGFEAGDFRAKERTGFLPENPYFQKFLSGVETVRYHGRLSGLGGGALERRVLEMLALVGLENAGDRPLRVYSKGMLQRLGMAQALVSDPDLLILDEPTSGVDPLGAREIRDLLIRLKERGKTIIFSTHLLDHVEEVADRVVIMHQGRKLVEGKLPDILEGADKWRVEVTGANEAVRVQDTLTASGLNAGVVRARRNLEELFLEAVKKGGKP